MIKISAWKNLIRKFLRMMVTSEFGGKHKHPFFLNPILKSPPAQEALHMLDDAVGPCGGRAEWRVAIEQFTEIEMAVMF